MGEEAKQDQKTQPAAAEEAKPPSPLVLLLDLHCVGCAKKIEKSVMRIRGVESVTMDMAQNQVTIKGIVEPQSVCAKIMKKTKRRAKVLSPEVEPMPQVSGLTTVELNVNMHCVACADQLKIKILKMRGVQTAVTELSTGKVTVSRTMDANKLVDYVYRRTKKQAKIVPQPKPEPALAPEPEKQEEKEEAEAEKPALAAEAAKNEENKNKGAEEPKKKGGGNNISSSNNNIDEENMKRMMYYYQPLYVIERIPPPQIFSDENPNACCIS